MDESAVREYLARGWREAAEAKAAYWAARFADDRLATWQASQALLDYVRRVRPAFPADADRRDDLNHHVELRSRLDRAAHAFARR